MRPASRTTMAWARCSASSMYWVVSSTVVPSATRSPMNCHRPFRVRGSRPVVGSSRNNTGGRLEVALVEVAQRVDDRLAESLEVGAPHRRVLAVDEREALLAVVRSVGHRDLDVLALEVDDGIERLAGEVLLEEVLQPVLRPEGLSVQGEREPAVQERVVPEHVLDELRPEPQVRAEELRVGHELDHRSEEHTSELQSLRHLVCGLVLENTTDRPLRASPRTRAPPGGQQSQWAGSR